MALTTTQLRRLWDPPCRGARTALNEAYVRLDAIFQKYNYAPRYLVTGAYNCRRITGGTGYSLHAYGPDGIFTFWTGVRVSKALAVDVNWDKNPYGPVLITDMPRAMIAEIKALRTNSGAQVWRWGGDYINNKDAMHFEICCSPSDLSTGIKWDEPELEEDDNMTVTLFRNDGSLDQFSIKKSTGNVWHYWSPSAAQLDKTVGENLGGILHSISAAWDENNEWLVLTGIGADDQIWIKRWGPVVFGEPRWDEWKKWFPADMS